MVISFFHMSGWKLTLAVTTVSGKTAIFRQLRDSEAHQFRIKPVTSFISYLMVLSFVKCSKRERLWQIKISYTYPLSFEGAKKIPAILKKKRKTSKINQAIIPKTQAHCAHYLIMIPHNGFWFILAPTKLFLRVFFHEKKPHFSAHFRTNRRVGLWGKNKVVRFAFLTLDPYSTQYSTPENIFTFILKTF